MSLEISQITLDSFPWDLIFKTQSVFTECLPKQQCLPFPPFLLYSSISSVSMLFVVDTLSGTTWRMLSSSTWTRNRKVGSTIMTVILILIMTSTVVVVMTVFNLRWLKMVPSVLVDDDDKYLLVCNLQCNNQSVSQSVSQSVNYTRNYWQNVTILRWWYET